MSIVTARRRLGFALLPAAGALALFGCSGDSVSDASADFCSNLEQLETDVTSLTALAGEDPSSEDVEQARDAVGEAYQSTIDAAGGLDQAVADSAETSYGAFQSQVDAISDDATLAEAAQQYATAAQAYLSSLATVASDAECTS